MQHLFIKLKNSLNIVNRYNPYPLIANSIPATGPASEIRGYKHRKSRQLKTKCQREFIITNLIFPLWNQLLPSIIQSSNKKVLNFFIYYRIPLFDNAAPQPRTHHWRRRYTKSRPC
ncbi:hypothetical protein BpHYR1_040914 [Brachionus plicatilis]|uniref:Uncharacterized protein n=1 Tax=Brachionus plicatilis TaxID=10195 RepID=A0A3M7PS51_BRAPC|nr:hypothetical protein BpHYR1_040914 [Brachionus plicatilis]